MSRQPLPKTKPLASGVLMLEAAIATIVLSFFAASSPQLFTARSATPPSPPVNASHTPQNQLLAITNR